MYATQAPDLMSRIAELAREAVSFVREALAADVGVRPAMAEEDGAEALTWSRYDFTGH